MVMHSMVIVFTGSKKKNEIIMMIIIIMKKIKEKKTRKTVFISSFYEFVICNCLAGSSPFS